MTHRHLCEGECCCSSVDKSCLILSDPMDWMKHARLPIPLSPEFSVSCPLTQWHYITVSSSVTLFSSFLQSFPTLGSFPRSELFASGGQSIGAFSISPSNEYSGLIFFQFSSVMSDSLWSHGLQHTRLPFHHHFPGFIQRIDVEAETPILWPPDAKSSLIWKDPDARKDWRQAEKGTTEDEMVEWYLQRSGHEFG